MPLVETVLNLLPAPLRNIAVRQRELIKFAIVGGTTFVFDLVIFYLLKLTVLEARPVSAKIIAGVAAMMLSYLLNRNWSFRSRGGLKISFEAVLFFVISGIGVVLSFIPLWISSYVFDLRVPNVSLTTENIADFVSAYIIGNLAQMAFRFWALRRWVFPHENARVHGEIDGVPAVSTTDPAGPETV